MNKKQRKTLQAIFSSPTPANIRWSDIESLLTASGAAIQEREGSRVAVRFPDGRVQVFHRPHPEPTTDKGTVKAVRKLLETKGILP